MSLIDHMQVKKEAVELIKRGSPEDISLAASLLVYYDIRPDAAYDAADRDYGWVRAWKVDDDLHIVRYWRRGMDIVAWRLANSVSDLAKWLEDEGARGLDKIVQTAKIYGLDHIPEADETVGGPYYILKIGLFDLAIDLAMDEAGINLLKFDTIDEARKWILNAEKQDKIVRDFLGYEDNGIDKPQYKIVVNPDDAFAHSRQTAPGYPATASQ